MSKQYMPDKRYNYNASTQTCKNLAWYLPRPRPDHYKGSMPLYAEEWLITLAADILEQDITTLKLLNLFCGMMKYGLRVDIKLEVQPHIVADAHTIASILSEQFNVILADPPYSTEEAAELYGTPKLYYKQWTGECDKLLVPGGLLMVYHKYVMPNPDPEKYIVAKRVFIGNRTYHLVRAVIVFQKIGG